MEASAAPALPTPPQGPVSQPAQVLLLAPPEARMANPQYLSPFESLLAACRTAVLQAKAKHRDKPRIKVGGREQVTWPTVGGVKVCGCGPPGPRGMGAAFRTHSAFL